MQAMEDNSKSSTTESEVIGIEKAKGSTRPTVISLTIRDKNALYAAFMPFVKGGGLFIPMNKPYKMGEEVFLLLNLIDTREKIPVAGTVVWLTPAAAQGNRAPGVGIQFSKKDSGLACSKIEAFLGGLLNSKRPTHTM